MRTSHELFVSAFLGRRPARLILALSASSTLWLVRPLAQQPQIAPDARPVSAFHARYEAPPVSPLAAPATEVGASADDVENVHLHSGEFHLTKVDLRIAGRGLDFVWGRTYRSRLGRETAIGHGWDFSYNLSIAAAANDVKLFDGNGRSDVYHRRADGTFVLHEFFREGRFNPDGTFTLAFADTGRWVFRALDGSAAQGRIQNIADRNGNMLQFGYDALGRLAQVIDTLGRAINVAYAGNRIASITDFTGRTVSYAYYQPGDVGGSPGDLKSVTSPAVTNAPSSFDWPLPLGNNFPNGKRTTYTYSIGFADERLNHNLLTVTDPRTITWLVNEYGTSASPSDISFDRLVRQTRGTSVDTLEIEYESLALPMSPAGSSGSATLRAIVNDAVGNVREYTYDARGRCLRKELFTGRAVNGTPTTSSSNRPGAPLRAGDPPSFVTTFEYSDDSRVTRIVHPAGNVTRYVRELELAPNAPWRARGNLRELRREPGTHPVPGDQPAGTVELFEHAVGFGGAGQADFVTRHSDARGNVTEHDYDAFGNRVQTRHAMPGMVEDWTYNAFGQLTSHTFTAMPGGYRRRDDFAYFGISDGCQNGYLKRKVEDAATLALTTLYGRDCVGNVTSIVDPNGNDRLWTYNGLDQVVREESPVIDDIVHPAYRIAKHTFYDGADNPIGTDTENRDENGVLSSTFPWTWRRSYHGILNDPQALAVWLDPAHVVVSDYAYDGNRNLVLLRKGEFHNGHQPNNVVAFLYDERDLLFRTTRAPGDACASTDERDYDANGNLAATLEGLENNPRITVHEYDSFDRLTRTTDMLGNVTERHYDPNGNVGGHVGSDASALHPFGERVLGQLLDQAGGAGNVRLAETMYEYEPKNALVRADTRHFDTQTQAGIGDGNSTLAIAYAAEARPLLVTGDSPAHTLSFEYDTLRRRAAATDALLNRIALTYDANGNVIGQVDTHRSDSGAPNQSFSHTYAYDALDRLVAAQDNLGNTTSFYYDSRDNRVLERDARGVETRYVYDALDRLVRIERDANGNGTTTDPQDLRVEQQYDDTSRIKSRTDSEGCQTNHAYDACDRRIVTQFADGTLEQIGSGATWSLGQPSPDLSVFTSGYDVHDNALERRDPNGSRVIGVHDDLDRLVSHSITPGAGVIGTTSETYQYDGLSRWIRAQNNGSLVTRGSSSTSGYDSLGHVLRETQQFLPAGTPRSVTASYDGASNLMQLVYPSGRVIDYTSDALDRVETIVDPSGAGITLATFDYIGPERVERRANGDGTLTTFGYDGVLGIPNASGDFGWRQVSASTHMRGATTLDARTYAYDRTQNKLRGGPKTYTYDSLERMVTSVTTGAPATLITYTFDLGGDRVQVAGPIDPGSYTSTCAHTIPTTPFDSRTYDANGNLKTSTNPSKTYSYDYKNRLVQVVAGATTSTYTYDCLDRRIRRNVAGVTTEHIYLAEAEIEERAPAALVTTWVYGDTDASPLQMKRGTDVYYYHEDDLGSPRVLTDASGFVRDTFDYGDYGKPTVTTAPATTFTINQPAPAGGSAIQSDSTPAQGTGTQIFSADDLAVAQTSTLTAVQWWGAYQPGTTTPTSNYDQPAAGFCAPSDSAPGPSGFAEWCADDFEFPQDWQLTRVTWRGAYDFPAAPPVGAGSFTVTLYHDGGGLPGAAVTPPLALGAITRTSTGQTISGYQYSGLEEFEYTAQVSPPLQLTGNVRYWLRIACNTSSWPPGSPTAGSWVWERTPFANGIGARFRNYAGNPGWFSTSEDMAFRLDLQGAPVPEPSQPDTDDFWIEVRADSGGVPSTATPLRTYHPANAVTRSATGNNVTVPNGSLQPEFRYTYAIPGATQLALAPGVRYWVVVYDATASFAGIWAWDLSTGATSNRALRVNGGNWSAFTGDHALQLTLVTGGTPTGSPLAFRGLRHDADTGLLADGARMLDTRAGKYLQPDWDKAWLSRVEVGNPLLFAGNAPVTSVAPLVSVSALAGNLWDTLRPAYTKADSDKVKELLDKLIEHFTKMRDAQMAAGLGVPAAALAVAVKKLQEALAAEINGDRETAMDLTCAAFANLDWLKACLVLTALSELALDALIPLPTKLGVIRAAAKLARAKVVIEDAAKLKKIKELLEKIEKLTETIEKLSDGAEKGEKIAELAKKIEELNQETQPK